MIVEFPTAVAVGKETAIAGGSYVDVVVKDAGAAGRSYADAWAVMGTKLVVDSCVCVCVYVFACMSIYKFVFVCVCLSLGVCVCVFTHRDHFLCRLPHSFACTYQNTAGTPSTLSVE
jgi:hypothetical protein